MTASEAKSALREIVEDDAAMANLHEIERMMAHDLQDEPRRARCALCLKLIGALYRKAKGYDYPGTKVGGHNSG